MSSIDYEAALCAMCLFLGVLLFTGSPVRRENKSSNRHHPFIGAFELRGGLGDFLGFDSHLKSFFFNAVEKVKRKFRGYFFFSHVFVNVLGLKF